MNEVISVKGKHIVKDSCFHQWCMIPDLTNNQDVSRNLRPVSAHRSTTENILGSEIP